MGKRQRIGGLLAGSLLLLAGWIALRPPPVPEARHGSPATPRSAEHAPRVTARESPPAAPTRAIAPSAAEDRRDLQVPTSEIVGTVAALEAKLGTGEADAGYPLFALLDQCARAPALAEQLRRDRRELPSGPMALPDSVLNEAQFLESECARLQPGLLARRFEFLEAAAAHGDLRARLDYAAYPPDYFSSTEGLVRHAEKVVEFKAKAVAWLHSAADRGSRHALLKLAGLYREGLLVERDDVTALAYDLAWEEVGGGGVDPHRPPREPNMTPAQLEQARQMQRRIVARCCR